MDEGCGWTCPQCRGEDLLGHSACGGKDDDAVECLECGFVWPMNAWCPAHFVCASCEQVVRLKERRKPHIVDLRPLYSPAERRETEQLLGLEQIARQYVAFTIHPR